ncbi:hypothetical protein [Pararhizobium haloflavum]|uniref:hypothetical protein n=1 Tax=Pararhizobium haloflavum TaxID=2037914 RepID=UPI000C173D68|nr:hypothetical protein [Pararhizobium haloflavum]
MLAALPLMIVPFAFYNIAMFGFIGLGGPQWLERQIVSLEMISGAVWTMSFGDLIIVIALAMLFIEILKATRGGRFQIFDHLMSLLVFVVFLVEFLLFQSAATDVFFILMAIAFIDVIAGFAVALRSAQRDVSIGL